MTTKTQKRQRVIRALLLLRRRPTSAESRLDTALRIRATDVALAIRQRTSA